MAHSEHVTILFTDLVGSTELTTSLSPEAADELRRAHFSGLRAALAANGGTEVKNLGDGLMVVFPAASAAIACAVGMQQAVERASRLTPTPLGLRVGISAGEATHEEDDYFGEPVIEAARLCAVANGGQVVVSDVVHANAGRRSNYEFRPLGALELKGLPEPVEALEVPWESLHSAENEAVRVPLPARLGIGPTIGVVGRTAEAELLADAWKRVTSGGDREMVLIGGEPGMGKTTLAAQCARAAADEGGCVLLGRGDEELVAPYGPFAEAVRHLVTHAPEDLLTSHVTERGAELARIAPELKGRLAELPAPQATDPDTERYLLFGAVVALLGRTAATAPVLLVLDDLQWADRASLRLLRHLMASDNAMRLLVVATYRDSELSAGHPLTETLAALRREHGVTRLELKGLDDTGVIAFMEAAAGHQLDTTSVGIAHALSRETDGNPFFVGEVLRNLAETGAILQNDQGTWSPAIDLADMVLPDSVREVIGSRAARLGEPTQQMLSAASVIGRDFDLALLAGITDKAEDQLLDLLDVASAAALVHEVPGHPGRFTFSHALIQHTLYSDLGATRRARAHQRVAEALEVLCGDDPGDRVGELAHHWASATEPVDVEKAISYSRQAGELALSGLAPDDAVRHYSQALRLLGQQADAAPTLRIDLLLGLGRAQRLSGVAAFRETLLEAAGLARELGDTERLVTAALDNSRGLFSMLGVVDEDRVEVLEAALAALPEEDSVARARLLARLCSENTWTPFEHRLALASAAKDMARRVGDVATLVDVVTDCATALRVPSELKAQFGEMSDLVASVDERALDPASFYWLCEHTYCEAIRATQFDLAEECVGRMLDVANQVRQPTLLWNVTEILASEAIRRGELDEAERLCLEALQIGQASGQPDADGFFSAQFFNIRNHQGRADELIEFVSELAETSPNSVAHAYRGALAAAYLDAGRDDDARALMEERLRAGFDDLPYDIVWFDTVLNYVRVPIWCELPEAAAALIDMIVPFEEQLQFEGVDLFAPVATYLGGLAGVLGRYDQAEAWFQKGERICVAGKMRDSQAENDLLWGRMLLLRDGPHDRETGLEKVTRAYEVAKAGGYTFLERRASVLLERAG